MAEIKKSKKAVRDDADPLPNRPSKIVNPTQFVFIRQFFSLGDMNGLLRYCEDIGFAGATFVDGRERDNVKTVFLDKKEHPAMAGFFNRIIGLARMTGPILDVEVTPDLLQFIQIARYLPGDHYGEHHDHDASRKNLEHDRKISIFGSITSNGALSMGDEYVNVGVGDLVVFPATMGHSAPVQQEGTRYSFVAWISGPQWR